ncbi:MAG: 3-hydroxyacyl-ACP dehydratase [Crocinitomicaceae bacterium]|nr:3-hydroxyacyl-ACP dehydratase [Crocinitomicaceae bacterium]
MLFKDDFYTIISSSQDEEAVTFAIQLNAEHAIFKGHFPDNPVTPGVAQMEIVKELMKVHTDKDLALKSMGNCKFLAILNPENDADVNVWLKISEQEDGSLKVAAVIKNETTSFLKMSAIYS